MELTATAVIVSVIGVGVFVALLVNALLGRHPDRQVSSSDQRRGTETYRLHGPTNDRPAGADTDIDADRLDPRLDAGEGSRGDRG